MTPPTTKLVAMTEKHIKALDIAIQCDLALSEFGDGYQKPLREIGSVVSSLASRETVNVPRREWELMQKELERYRPVYTLKHVIALPGSGYPPLASDSPKEKATAENPVFGER